MTKHQNILIWETEKVKDIIMTPLFYQNTWNFVRGLKIAFAHTKFGLVQMKGGGESRPPVGASF